MAFNFEKKDYGVTTPTRVVGAQAQPSRAFIPTGVPQTMVPLAIDDGLGPYTTALYSSSEPHLEFPPWLTPTASLSPPSVTLMGRNDAENLNTNVSDSFEIEKWLHDLSIPSRPTATLPFHVFEDYNIPASRPQFAAPTLIHAPPIWIDEPYLYSAKVVPVEYPVLNQVVSPSTQSHPQKRSSDLDAARKRCLRLLSLAN